MPDVNVTESRLTRTSAGTVGTGSRTSITSTSTRRARRIVRAVVRAAEAWRATSEAVLTASRWAGRTVRPAGAVVTIAATAGLIAGLVFGWVEWMVAGSASLLLLIMSVPFLFGSRAYAVDLTLARERVVAGHGVTGEIIVRNESARVALPGRLDIPVGSGLVEFGVPFLRPGHSVTETLEIPPLPRGVVTVGPVTTVRSDPIGLLRREHAFDDENELFVHPRTVPLPSTSAGLVRDLEGNASRRLVDADMSFHAIREYAPGDSQRQVHWKSTAKTGRLMVRQYEESLRSRMAVVLGAASQEYLDADEYELAVSAAASLGLRAVRDARDIDIVTGSEIPRVVKGRLRAIRRIPTVTPRQMLDGFSALERSDNTMSVSDVCRLASESNERLSIAFIVVGSRVPLARVRQAALAFPVDTAVAAVVCDERAHPRMQSIAGLTVLTIGTLDDLSGLLVRGATS
ncbi:hypothetical protein NS220_03705 [Microbacterium testaceum]|uniref:DUF58 domain-containing protein n=1 Tax=Microbacterium testaceum TaxID=2033 RepID=A0A147F022_MICTE|nr:DUF58 domain-containing protein [Microbacterium testaceum]KTR96058.1 hypothetical protein NS220_03705 [Microbacterium testaceum]